MYKWRNDTTFYQNYMQENYSYNCNKNIIHYLDIFLNMSEKVKFVSFFDYIICNLCTAKTCEQVEMIFTCVTKGESRSRSAVTPSVCPKILSSQLLWNYWSNYQDTWYVDRTSYLVMHIGRKFWSPHFYGSYALGT